ncbi:MAG: hypothetical protein ACTSSF_11825 [Candidatus Heimdallarchaeaceae archaeon]
MSLVLTLKGRDGIVIASDSRATIGDPRGLVTANDTVKKLFKVNDKVIMGVAGEANLGISIVHEILQDDKITQTTDLKSTMNAIRNKAFSLLKQWLDNPEVITPQGIIKRWPQILFLVAGYDENNPNMYILNSHHFFAPELSTLNFAAIGVVPLAVYLLNRLHDPRAKVDSLKLLAAYCIMETASQDGKVGGPIQMLVLSPNKVEEVPNEEIDALAQEASKHNEMLRKAFYEEGEE